jgi:peptidyl-prolyl cis-trans isomerase C
MASTVKHFTFCKHKKIAEDIIKQLVKGAKFQALVKKYSSCLFGKKGGDLGEYK